MHRGKWNASQAHGLNMPLYTNSKHGVVNIEKWETYLCCNDIVLFINNLYVYNHIGTAM